MKKQLSMVLAAALTLSTLSGIDVQAAKKPTLNKKKVTLTVGKTTTLKLKNNKKTVKWSSSKKSVATVNKKGKVTAKKAGKAKITAKVNRKKYICTVTVKAINPKKNSLPAQQTAQATVEETTPIPRTESTSSPDVKIVETASPVPTDVPTDSPLRTIVYDGKNGDEIYDAEELVHVVIQDGITRLGEREFNGCTNIASVTIPNSVTTIDWHAFGNCINLESITIPESVTSMDNVFQGCKKLEEIVVAEGNNVYDSRDNCNAVIETATNTLVVGCAKTIIPDSVTSIAAAAFYRCETLKNITIPDTITSIGDHAFESCYNLASITIPASVTSIGRDVVASCNNLKEISIAEGNEVYDSRDNCNAIIDIATNTLIAGCDNTTIPDSVISIGDGAFSGCVNLKNISIPDSITSIGNEAFYRCENLNSIIIPDSVTSIGNEAFYRCENLNSIVISDGVEKIGDNALSYCDNLKEIKISEGNKVFDSRDNCNGVIQTETNTLIIGCVNTVIPNSVTTIGNDAFNLCVSLTSIEIPNGVETIGSSAFYGCSNLQSVTISGSVKTIGYHAFQRCENLTSITIPDGVTTIDDGAFSFCNNLEEILVSEENSVYDSRNNCNAIIETATNTLISGCANTTIPDTVTTIGEDAFAFCMNLTDIVIPDSVTSIGDSAFYLCDNLTSITIPDSVASIGNYTFNDCPKLREISWNGNIYTNVDEFMNAFTSTTDTE